MGRKFRLGNRVRVIKHEGDKFSKGFYIGSIGTITEYESNLPYPYRVHNREGNEGQFMAKELRKTVQND